MMDRDVNFSHLTPGIISDARIREGRSKVKLVSHQEWPAHYNSGIARVLVKLKDGREFPMDRSYPIGSREEPLTREQFKSLYLKFVRGIVPENQMEKIAEPILNLEKLSDMEEIIDLLTFRHKMEFSNTR